MSERANEVLARVLAELPVVSARAASLDEVSAWLTAQRGVVACRIDPSLLKSQPPQRVVEVVLAGSDAQRTATLRFRVHPSGAVDLLDVT